LIGTAAAAVSRPAQPTHAVVVAAGAFGQLGHAIDVTDW
jgi:hypothetical protein